MTHTKKAHSKTGVTMPAVRLLLNAKFLLRNALFVALGSLVYEVHKLVELRSDDNLCTAVTLLAHLGIVGCKRVVLATSACGKALGVYTEMILQILHYR